MKSQRVSTPDLVRIKMDAME